MRITRVERSAVVGQRFCGESGPRRFLHIGLKFEYTEVNVAQHKLGLNVQLPFGITVREDLDCMPLSSTQCRVNYHCNFGFAKGWLVLSHAPLRAASSTLDRLTRCHV